MVRGQVDLIRAFIQSDAASEAAAARLASGIMPPERVS